MMRIASVTARSVLLTISFLLIASAARAQNAWAGSLYAAAGFRGTLDHWPNSEIRGLGAGGIVGLDVRRHLHARFGLTVGAAMEMRRERGDPLDERHEAGASMQWFRAGLVFYPPEISWVHLTVAAARLRIDLSDAQPVQNAVFIFDSLREDAMWHNGLVFGGNADLPLRGSQAPLGH